MGRVFLLVAALAVGTTLSGCTGANDRTTGDPQTMSHDSGNGGEDHGTSNEEMGGKDTGHQGMGAGPAGATGAAGNGSQDGNGAK